MLHDYLAMQHEFSTERLHLSLITEHDYAFTRLLVNTPGWLQYIGDRHVHTDEEAVAYIRKIRTTPHLYYWVVRLKESNIPIGIVSFLKRSYLDHFDVGFAFMPERMGQGYALEAATAVLDQARCAGTYTTVLAVTLPANQPSVRLLEKLHMRRVKEVQNDKQEKLLVYELDLLPEV